MNSLPVVSGRKIIKALAKRGFYVSRQRGSHVVLVKYIDGKKLVVVVPDHKEVDPGTLLAIISQSGMTRDEFLGYL